MKKVWSLLLFMFVAATILQAQDEEKKGFKKENFFTGGSISLAFGGNSFLVGASPVFGYNVTHWADAGIIVNYNYTSYHDYYNYDDKLRQTVYGGGAFVKIYPVRFLFAQAQFEHNFIRQKYIYPGSGITDRSNYDVNSLFVGGGFTTSRFPGSGDPFFYLAVLFDVSGNKFSPYVSNTGSAIPIIRAGIQVPLFQGNRRNNYEEERESGSKKPRHYNN